MPYKGVCESYIDWNGKGMVGVKHLPIKNTLNASLIFAVNMFACHEARPVHWALGVCRLFVYGLGDRLGKIAGNHFN